MFTNILRIHGITAVNFYFEFQAFMYQLVGLLVENVHISQSQIEEAAY